MKSSVNFDQIDGILDAGWNVSIFKTHLGTYSARARRCGTPYREEIEFVGFTSKQAMEKLSQRICVYIEVNHHKAT